MQVPSSLIQVAALLVLVVPGLVFAAVRRALLGPVPEDREVGVRVSRAIAASAALNAVYAFVLGPYIIGKLTTYQANAKDPLTLLQDDVRPLSALAAVLLVIIPATAAAVSQLRFGMPGKNDHRFPVWLERRHHPTPTAWDKAAASQAGCGVRIFTEDGYWVGGWVADGGRSFVSKYPEPRDIFLEYEWRMDKEGNFVEELPGSRGLYVPLSGKERVSWITLPSSPPPESPEPLGSDYFDSSALA